MKLIIAAAAALIALSGCASTSQTLYEATNCHESERLAIQAENDRLIEAKKLYEAYADGSIPIPGAIHSDLNQKELVSAYFRGYNRSVDALEYRSSQFNKYCAGKAPYFARNKN